MYEAVIPGARADPSVCVSESRVLMRVRSVPLKSGV